MRKMNYSFLNSVKLMPPLEHSTAEPFDITKSEVVKYLMNCPKVMQKVFDVAANHGMIKYNSDTGKWQGVDFEDGD